MGCETNGISRPYPGRQLLHSYAMVIYIPDPLGRFLDDLRRELVPTYRPHAHISVLPPRALAGNEIAAREQMHRVGADIPPFDIELSRIATFPITEVVYLEVGDGEQQVRDMHQHLNSGPLAADEPFVFHPHVTLAQDFNAGELERIHSIACQRWEEYAGPRRFRAERLTFVQNRPGNVWVDVDEHELRAVPA
jgi:2'-5' RNA ligase